MNNACFEYLSMIMKRILDPSQSSDAAGLLLQVAQLNSYESCPMGLQVYVREGHLHGLNNPHIPQFFFHYLVFCQAIYFVYHSKKMCHSALSKEEEWEERVRKSTGCYIRQNGTERRANLIRKEHAFQ